MLRAPCSHHLIVYQSEASFPVAREQRKLAAIRTTDVVGCFRLMRRDESGTLARQGAAISSRIVAVAINACQSYTTVETPNERTLLPGH